MTRIGVTGHQNIPAAVLPQVRAGIEHLLADVAGEFTGITSLAAGADQLFARAVLERNGTLHAIIPCHGYESTFDDPAVLASFRELLASATAVETLPHVKPSQQAFLEAGHRVVELSQWIVAVWDGKEAQGLGGTADIVYYARSRSRRISIVWPPGATR